MAQMMDDGSIKANDGTHWIFNNGLLAWFGWTPGFERGLVVKLPEEMETEYPEVLALASDGDARRRKQK